MINRYSLDQMSADQLRALCARSEADISSIRETVRLVIENVRSQGDRALVRYTQQFDGVDISDRVLEVTGDEIARGCDALSHEIKFAVDYAAKNIRLFHRHKCLMKCGSRK